MSRTIKTVNRPAPHVFDEDPDVPADWQGRHFCRAVVASAQDHGGLRRCALRESDSVHVTREDMAASLPPVPPEAQEIDARILGEA